MRNTLTSCALAAVALILFGNLTHGAGSGSAASRTDGLRHGPVLAAGIGPGSVPRLHVAWTARAGSVVNAIATEARVFVVEITAHGYSVVMLDARNGKALRSFNAASLGFAPVTVAWAGGRLIVAGLKATIALNPDTGKRYWRAAAGATSVNVAGNTIYTGKYCQNSANVCGPAASYAINLSNGRVLWKHRGGFREAPDYVAGRLYQVVGANGSETRVYEPSTGALVAQLPYGAQWLGDGNTVYAYVLPRAEPGAAPARRGWLGRISSTGKPVWKLNLGVLASGSAVLVHGTLYVDSNRFHPGVIAVKASNGHIQWGANLGRDLQLRATDRLLFVLEASNGRLSVLNAGNGRVLRQLTVPHSTNVSPGIAFQSLLLEGDSLYAVGNGIVAIR